MARERCDVLEVDIAHHATTREAIDADVDHHHSGLDHVGGDESGLAGGGSVRNYRDVLGMWVGPSGGEGAEGFRRSHADGVGEVRSPARVYSHRRR